MKEKPEEKHIVETERRRKLWISILILRFYNDDDDNDVALRYVMTLRSFQAWTNGVAPGGMAAATLTHLRAREIIHFIIF